MSAIKRALGLLRDYMTAGGEYDPRDSEILAQAHKAYASSLEVVEGLLEIAEEAMPDTFFATDRRIRATREFLRETRQ